MKKLQDIQIELKLKKNQRNDYGKYNFRNIEVMLNEVKDVFKKHNAMLQITHNIVEVAGEPFIETVATYINLDSDYTQSSKAYAAIDFDQKGMSKPQACGSSMTYNSKYALNALLLIDDGSDDCDAMPPKGYEDNQPQQQSNQPKKVDFADIDKINSLDELEKWYRENEPLLKTENQKNAVIKKCGYRKKLLMQGNIILPNKDLEYND